MVFAGLLISTFSGWVIVSMTFQWEVPVVLLIDALLSAYTRPAEVKKHE